MALSSASRLTRRERRILRRILAGRRNREIARELGITQQPVKNAVSIIYEKCGVRTPLDLVVVAARRRRRKRVQ